jgi:hypothetical protein
LPGIELMAPLRVRGEFALDACAQIVLIADFSHNRPSEFAQSEFITSELGIALQGENRPNYDPMNGIEYDIERQAPFG